VFGLSGQKEADATIAREREKVEEEVDDDTDISIDLET